jgi:hypothetical protein
VPTGKSFDTNSCQRNRDFTRPGSPVSRARPRFDNQVPAGHGSPGFSTPLGVFSRQADVAAKRLLAIPTCLNPERAGTGRAMPRSELATWHAYPDWVLQALGIGPTLTLPGIRQAAGTRKGQANFSPPSRKGGGRRHVCGYRNPDPACSVQGNAVR